MPRQEFIVQPKCQHLQGHFCVVKGRKKKITPPEISLSTVLGKTLILTWFFDVHVK